jgi:hypothetical protein
LSAGGTLAAALVLVSSAGTAAVAETLSLVPHVAMESSYDTNPRLLAEQARNSVGLAVVVELPVTYALGSSTFELTPRLRQTRSQGDPSLLSNYRYLDASWRVERERGSLQAQASTGRDTTLFDALENAAGLGRTQYLDRQLASLEWQHTLSERSDLTVGADWTRVNYDRAGLSDRDNYRYLSSDARYLWKLTSRTALLASLGAGRYRTGDGAYVSDSRQAQLGVISQLTERWSASGVFGTTNVRNRVSTPAGPAEAANRGSVFSIDARRAGELLQLSFSASRSVQPTGLGVLATEDQAAAQADYALTERLSCGLGVDLTRIEDALGGDAIGRRRFARAHLSASWRWQPDLTLGVQAVRSERQLLPQDERAAGWGLYFSLRRDFGRVALH